MAGLINTAEGYLAQTIGQLQMEKAGLLGVIDQRDARIVELEAEVARLSAEASNEPV